MAASKLRKATALYDGMFRLPVLTICKRNNPVIKKADLRSKKLTREIVQVRIFQSEVYASVPLQDVYLQVSLASEATLGSKQSKKVATVKLKGETSAKWEDTEVDALLSKYILVRYSKDQLLFLQKRPKIAPD